MISRMKIPPEGAVLLSMLRASLSETPSVPENLPPPIDWDLLQRMARYHRLGPLLGYGLRRCQFSGIPALVRGEWEARRRNELARALYNQEAIVEIAAAFEKRGVPFVLLKGEAISQALYPQEGLRPYYDLDLLIQPESYEAAKAILGGLGFQPKQPSEESEKRRLFGEIEFEKDDPRSLPVDLHWDTLMVSWEERSLFREPATWASLDRIRLKDRDLPVLRGEPLLLYLCLHFAFHQVFNGLILLCDLFLLLRRDLDRIDWDHLVALATRCRCRNALYYSLSFAQALMAAQVPKGILDQLRPSALNRVLMPRGRLLFRDDLLPQMLERYVKFLLIDTHQGRWRAANAWLQSSKRLFGR